MFYFIINMHKPCMSDLAGSTTYSHFASSLPVNFYAKTHFKISFFHTTEFIEINIYMLLKQA